MPVVARGEADPSWIVDVQGRGSYAPEQPHEVRYLGGGPRNFVPGLYWEEWDRLMKPLRGPRGAAWWASSTVPLLEVLLNTDASRSGVTLRVSRGGYGVCAYVNRTRASFPGTDPRKLARADFEQMLARLSDRFRLDRFDVQDLEVTWAPDPIAPKS